MFYNNKLMIKLFFGITVITLNGCMMMPPMMQPPTAEEIEARQQILQNFLGRMNQTPAQVEQPVTKQPVASLTEADLKKQMDQFPKLERGVSFTKKRDGFDVDGRRYLDPEGAIVKYGYDPITGDVTYLVQSGDSSFTIKYMRASADSDAITIGFAEVDSDGWIFKSVTGKTLRGRVLVPVAKGVVVSRDTAGFIYEPGQGTKSVGVPDSFTIASFQNGNVQSSRYLLLERVAEESDSLFSKVSSLGATIGISKKEDYMYFNIDSGEQIPINVSFESKQVAELSECRQGRYVNKCAKADFYEALYDKSGTPNAGHYFWRTSWISTNSGPLLIWTDSGFGTKTYIYNPRTKKKVVAFSRALGINYFTVKDEGKGKYSITAQLGLSKETIDDIEKYFNEAPAVSEATTS